MWIHCTLESLYIYIYICVCVCVYMCVYMYVCVYVFEFVCACVCVCVCVCVCRCIHMNTHACESRQSSGQEIQAIWIQWREFVIKLICVCDMTILMWDTTHSYVWRDLIMCVAWFVCETWLFHMWAISHSYWWHDSFIRETWLIRMCDTPHLYISVPLCVSLGVTYMCMSYLGVTYMCMSYRCHIHVYVIYPI